MRGLYSGQVVLVIAPHQDDETVGCGGIVQKYRKHGSSVYVVFGTVVGGEYRKFDRERGEYDTYTGKTREAEVDRALGILDIRKVPKTIAPSSEHHRLDTLGISALLGPLEEVVRLYRPTVLLIPSMSSNQDHTAIRNACTSLIRPHFFSGLVLEYEICGETDFTPNFYVGLEESELENKIEAFKAYETQNTSEMHPVSVSGIVARALYRGKESFKEYAEAFRVVKWVV